MAVFRVYSFQANSWQSHDRLPKMRYLKRGLEALLIISVLFWVLHWVSDIPEPRDWYIPEPGEIFVSLFQMLFCYIDRAWSNWASFLLKNLGNQQLPENKWCRCQNTTGKDHSIERRGNGDEVQHQKLHKEVHKVLNWIPTQKNKSQDYWKLLC